VVFPLDFGPISRSRDPRDPPIQRNIKPIERSNGRHVYLGILAGVMMDPFP